MACLCVSRSGLLALGQRAGLTLAGVALAMAVGSGGALAATEPVGISPAKDVVAWAPLAVSVTFGQALRSAGATMQVLGPAGDDVGLGPVTTAERTLRRHLRQGAPGGDYTIQWTATSVTGRRMAGSFTFTAARGNSPSTSAAFRPSLTPVPTASPAQPGQQGQVGPTATEKPFPETNYTFGAAAIGARPTRDHDRDKFTIVPLVVGALLVLAAGLVARFNRRPRVHA